MARTTVNRQHIDKHLGAGSYHSRLALCCLLRRPRRLSLKLAGSLEEIGHIPAEKTGQLCLYPIPVRLNSLCVLGEDVGHMLVEPVHLVSY